ncbi:3-ketodihydrosphingosine reductase [Euwallacea fornicatus]|uniref:3-ketodihydrosphingosine reductase n=1 Tax=Euwallacea fornicatus TaxID=995702 RepID=UPI003390494D
MFYIVLAFVLIGFTLKFLNHRCLKSLQGRHVLITGGSSGIGKALAILVAKKGAHVSIVARNVNKLNGAQKEIEKHINKNQIITTISADVSDKENIQKKLLELDETIAPIYMLVNCAGQAICGKLEHMSESDIKQMINVNWLGTLYPIQAIIPKFKERKEGIIVVTASVVALMGMFGYSVYSSCKFALRGLAESISMELKPYNVSVTLALPPDTDTPGFEIENKTKPKETKLLSKSGGLHSPESVAQHLLDDALKGHFFSYIGFESFILTTLCIGMSPFNNVIDILLQSLLMGPIRLIAAFYVKHFEGIVRKCYNHDKQS